MCRDYLDYMALNLRPMALTLVDAEAIDPGPRNDLTVNDVEEERDRHHQFYQWYASMELPHA